MPAGGIEQLHYTWAARGAEGVNRFQIAAISAGLKAPAMGPLLPLARKVCRYDRPPSEGETLPVSFGWFEYREHRIAFSRVGIPRSQDKRGNFAAHILVGPAAALAEADVASTFGSPFWWRGERSDDEEDASAERSPTDFELPALDREQILRDRIEPGGPAPDPALVLARRLLGLSAGERLTVVDDGSAFGGALRVVAQRLPEALDGISLSTYEGRSSGLPLDVIGTVRAVPGGSQCDLSAESIEPTERGLLEALLGNGREAEQLRAAAREARPTGAQRRGEALWEAAGRLRALSEAEGVVDSSSARALASPGAIVYVSRVPAGVANVAVAARAGGKAMLAALRSAWEELAGEPREALGDALAQTHLAAADLAGIAALGEALPSGEAREQLLDSALEAALADVELARTLRAEDAVTMVDRAARRGIPVASARPLLQGVAGHLGSCADVATLPQAYLAEMFRAALGAGGSDAALLSTLLRRPALLVGVELDEEEKGACLALLERLGSAQLEQALASLLPPLADPERRPRLDVLLSRLSASAAGRALVQALAGSRAGLAQAPRTLSEMADDRAAPLIEAGVAPIALELLQLSRSSTGPTAARLFDATVHRSPGSALAAAREARRLEHGALRVAIGERACACAVADARSRGDFFDIWDWFGELYGGKDEGERLAIVLGYELDAADPFSAAALLGWICHELLPQHPGLLDRRARLRNRQAEQRAHALAAGLSWQQLGQAEPDAERADRRTRSWWKSLDNHRRKESRRQRKRGESAR